MCISRNVPTCAWCFGVHTKNIGGGVISTEVYPMIVEGAAILLVSSEGGVIVVHTKQQNNKVNIVRAVVCFLCSRWTP